MQLKRSSLQRPSFGDWRAAERVLGEKRICVSGNKSNRCTCKSKVCYMQHFFKDISHDLLVVEITFSNLLFLFHDI